MCHIYIPTYECVLDTFKLCQLLQVTIVIYFLLIIKILIIRTKKIQKNVR